MKKCTSSARIGGIESIREDSREWRIGWNVGNSSNKVPGSPVPIQTKFVMKIKSVIEVPFTMHQPRRQHTIFKARKKGWTEKTFGFTSLCWALSNFCFPFHSSKMIDFYSLHWFLYRKLQTASCQRFFQASTTFRRFFFFRHPFLGAFFFFGVYTVHLLYNNTNSFDIKEIGIEIKNSSTNSCHSGTGWCCSLLDSSLVFLRFFCSHFFFKKLQKILK